MLTKTQIEELNKSAPYDQGVFMQPYGIPDGIKEHVIYMRSSPGGVEGGSCWESSNPQRYTNDEAPEFVILDSVLEKLKPNITYLEYKKISAIINSSETSEWEYYGNSTDWNIQFIRLSELYKLLNIS